MDDAFSAGVLGKLPLGEACYTALRWALDEQSLNNIFEEHRGSCYQGELSFSTIVQLIADSLIQYEGSGRASFEDAIDKGRLPTSVQAVYGKLSRIPVAVSEAFLAATSQRLRELVPENVEAFHLPACFDGWTVLGMDGKTVKRVPRLLKPLRKLKAGILGGKASVALDIRTKLVVSMKADPDGYADELVLTKELQARVREEHDSDDRPILFVLDRLYCNREIPSECLKGNGHFVIRFGGNMSFEADPTRKAKKSTTRDRAAVTEEWGWLGIDKTKPRVYVRRVSRECGTKTLRVVTDLIDRKKYRAAAILRVYLGRWNIECVFQQITEVFSLEKLISTSSEGTIFQLAFCLLLYNTIQVVRAVIAQQQKREVETISTEKLFESTRRQLIAVNELVPLSVLLQEIALNCSAASVRRRLQKLLRNTWRNRWIKCPTRSRTDPMPKTSVRGNQTTIFRELTKEKEARQRC